MASKITRFKYKRKYLALYDERATDKVATKNDLLREIRSVWRKIELDRPLALRGYVTNASFKQ